MSLTVTGTQGGPARSVVTSERMKIAPADIRAFVHRDRSRVERAKRAHWARTSRDGDDIGLELSHALYEHAKAVSPGFPSQRSREDDLAHHVRLKGRIDRVARSLAVRRGSR
jgi:hypothetical protein